MNPSFLNYSLGENFLEENSRDYFPCYEDFPEGEEGEKSQGHCEKSWEGSSQKPHHQDHDHDHNHGKTCCQKKEHHLKEEKEYFLRALAESENSRKRLEKQTEEKIKYAISQFSTELLVVRDNMERALSSASMSTNGDLLQSVESLRQGIELVLQELDRIFSKFGILKIPSLGQPVNPYWHQVMNIEDHDEDNGEKLLSDHEGEFTIVNVLQEGYKLHDLLLRPALVGVRKLS